MKLVEKHLFKNTSPYFGELDRLAFKSKNLDNCGIYLCRQAFF